MREAKYYTLSVILGEDDDDNFPMQLTGLPQLPDFMKNNWMYGRPFTIAPEEPMMVKIDEGDDDCQEVAFHENPAIASDAFIDALLEVGVDNIDTYEVILKSSTDENFQIHGYKAFNIIGRISLAGPDTTFLTESRQIDASIENYQPKPVVNEIPYIFRLAESISTIVIHEKVKNNLEAKGFKRLDIVELRGAFIL